MGFISTVKCDSDGVEDKQSAQVQCSNFYLYFFSFKFLKIEKLKKYSNNLTSGHVLFSEQLSTVFHFLFSFVLSFSLFLGTSQLWMGWQHSCSSSFHSFKTCWLVTMAVFSLSQLSAFVELWHVSILMYFLHLSLKLSHLNLFPFTLPVSLLITERVDCPEL